MAKVKEHPQAKFFRDYAKKENNRRASTKFNDLLARKIASHMHYRSCSYSHTDQCSFGYEDTDACWNDPTQMTYTFDEHLKCYTAAEKVIANADRKELEVYVKWYDKLFSIS